MNKIKRYSTLIAKALKNKGKNYPFVFIVFRLLFWTFIYRGGIAYFFMLNLHKKDHRFNQVVGNKEFMRIHDKLNPVYYRVLLEDKYVFDRFMRSFNVPLVEMRGLIFNDKLKWIDEGRTEPLDNITKYDLDCYFKMHTKWGGQDVHKLEIHNGDITIDNKASNLQDFKDIASGALFVIQTRIKQHPEINRINGSCVNTVRTITIHDGERAHNFMNYLRIGVSNSIVDNVSHGGLGCGIGEDGILFETAMDKYGFSGWITHHPDSKVEFKGCKIPFYQEALKMVVIMHQCFHCFFMIGWDVVITESGPVILEANPVGGLLYEQSLHGGVRAKFLEYANSYRKRRSLE